VLRSFLNGKLLHQGAFDRVVLATNLIGHLIVEATRKKVKKQVEIAGYFSRTRVAPHIQTAPQKLHRYYLQSNENGFCE
jgi:hypothetical protein